MKDYSLQNYKIVLTGEYSVGKSSLMCRYTKNRFDENSVSTIGAAFSVTKAPNGLNIGIWDTAGHERYNSLLPLYFRGAHVIIYCIDSTRNCDISKINKDIENLKLDTTISTKIFFAVTKCDVKNRKIESLESYVNDKIYYTSSKTGENIQELFTDIGLYLENIKPDIKETLAVEHEKKKKCCNI